MTDKKIKASKERSPQFTVVVDSKTKERFKSQAKKRGLNVSAWLRMLGHEDIARNDF